jgi:phytoene dehydrogenase-like protein
MEKFDAAIIGAGADGLAAAVVLARAGLSTIVVERNARPGGRLETREFHPGYRASVYADEIAPIPREIFWSLDLARRGALFMPQPELLAVWPDRHELLDPGGAAATLMTRSRQRAEALLARALGDIPRTQAVPYLSAPKPALAWPSEDWGGAALSEIIDRAGVTQTETAQLAAWALCGRAADPHHPGSALHLVVPGAGSSGVVRGGLGALSTALEEAARQAGAHFSFGLEVADIRRARGRVRGVTLADGTEIAARSVISTLDLKRSVLSLFSWTALPPKLVSRVNGFRMAAGTARLLVALDSLPESMGVSGALWRRGGPVHVAPDTAALREAFAAWRNGALPEALPLTVRFPSARDPQLAPVGAATMTVTIGAVPHRLFDGAWTHEKRDALRDRALKAIEAVIPGMGDRVRAMELLVPPDFEEALGATDGDLDGGEIAPDQFFSTRPWIEGPRPPRTPLKGLYIAGPSTLSGLLASCASGVAAARAVLADARSWWFP